jgi:hypothetical protein
MPKPPIEINLGDVVQMRKAHPCGGDTWRVVRLGAEIGIRCVTCDRKVLLPRATFERRVKRFVERGGQPDTAVAENRQDAEDAKS